MNESELVFDKNGVNIRTLTEVPIIGGEKWVPIERISYNKLSSLSNGLNMTVTSIKPEIKNGILVELKFQISDFNGIKSTKEETIQHKIFKKAENEKTLPGYRYEYATRINKHGTQENLIKTTIKDKGRISDVELRNILKKSGYTGDSGAIGATIKVLKDDTKDVNVEGRGEHKTYIWIEPVPIEDPEKLSTMTIETDTYEIRNLYDILVNTAEWLIKKGNLSKEKCPISNGHKRNLVNIQPKHKNGDDFRAPKKLSNGLYIETHWDKASCITNAQKLLEICGYRGDMLKL